MLMDLLNILFPTPQADVGQCQIPHQDFPRPNIKKFTLMLTE